MGTRSRKALCIIQGGTCRGSPTIALRGTDESAPEVKKLAQSFDAFLASQAVFRGAKHLERRERLHFSFNNALEKG